MCATGFSPADTYQRLPQPKFDPSTPEQEACWEAFLGTDESSWQAYVYSRDNECPQDDTGCIATDCMTNKYLRYVKQRTDAIGVLESCTMLVIVG